VDALGQEYEFMMNVVSNYSETLLMGQFLLNAVFLDLEPERGIWDSQLLAGFSPVPIVFSQGFKDFSFSDCPFIHNNFT
jgi:hypothetical protein